MGSTSARHVVPLRFEKTGVFMRKLVVFALFLFAAALMFAQNNGQITGAVTDPSGAVVPDAKVTAKNSNTGAVYEGGASQTGNYVISVPIGTYELTIDQKGFKKVTQKNIQVDAQATVRADVKLEVGTTETVVTVSDTAP